MEKNARNEMRYNKTDFNNYLICQFSNVFKCSKCKRNNSITNQLESLSQNCMFCGNPNYIKRENKSKICTLK